EIGGGRGLEPLHDRKAQTTAQCFVDLCGINHEVECSARQQPDMCTEHGEGIRFPGFGAKSAICRSGEAAALRLLDEGCIRTREFGLDLCKFIGRDADRARPRRGERDSHVLKHSVILMLSLPYGGMRADYCQSGLVVGPAALQK